MNDDDESGSGLVERLSPDLTGDQRRHLQGLAHDLHPVVQVGQRGISDSLVENFEAQILAHELIKVKVHDAGALEVVAQQLHERTGAQLAQQIGKMLIFYKPHPQNPDINLPSA